MRINWKTLRNKIPPRIRIGKTIYEIVWVSEFKDPTQVGETRFGPFQIAIKTGLIVTGKQIGRAHV